MDLTFEMKEKIERVFGDKEFLTALAQIETAEEAQKVLAEKGIDLTIEEVQQLGEVTNGDNELDDEALDSVSGGITGTAVIIGGIAVCCAVAGVKLAWGAATKTYNKYVK